MAINARNVIVGQNKVEETKSPQPTTKAQSTKEHPAADIVEGEHIVVANGKAKKIRKQSQYLLDMLTIDD